MTGSHLQKRHSGDHTVIRARLQKIALLPAAAGLVLLGIAAVLALLVEPSFLYGVVVSGMVVAAIAVVLLGLRLIRRACTTVCRHLSSVRLFFEYPESAELTARRRDLDALEEALRFRLFGGLVPLMSEKQTAPFVTALRDAATGWPPQLSEGLEEELASLEIDCERWLDTLA
ncbi:hypothetical protein ACFWVF_19835 [Streptomyces sp. NPDC058659]|uniref:hypothetical protein n=1 Tax=Streptomyces sp. NPDC058659 TaxID=3346581 RepID=UPI003666ECBB